MKQMPFSDDMVLRILAGKKCESRRTLKIQPPVSANVVLTADGNAAFDAGSVYGVKAPFHAGDIVWVRESAKVVESTWNGTRGKVQLEYRADGIQSEFIEYPTRLQPLCVGQSVPNGIFKEAARIFLRITKVRLERLNEISRGDAMAEGCPFSNLQRGPNPRDWFRDLWESIYGKGSFDSRWVWVFEFQRVASTTSGGAK